MFTTLLKININGNIFTLVKCINCNYGDGASSPLGAITIHSNTLLECIGEIKWFILYSNSQIA